MPLPWTRRGLPTWRHDGFAGLSNYRWSFPGVLNGTTNGFVAKLGTAGSALVYSTLIGGSSTDRVTSLAVDGASQAVIAGSTSSTNFPLVSATQPVYAGSGDAFAAVLSDSGGTLLFSTYLGGSGADLANTVAVFPGNQMYIAGTTSSDNFPDGRGHTKLTQRRNRSISCKH